MPAGFGQFVSKALKSGFTPPNTGYGVSGALFAGSLAAPVVEGLFEPGLENQAVRAENENQRRLLLAKLRQDRIKRHVQQAAAKLASRDPHLFQEIIAGERLVPGEIVIGGQPRMDLLGKIAGRMAMGQYQQPTNIEDQVMAFLQQR